MSWFSDFDKLHVTSKSAVLSLVVLFPFWFVSIYLFNRPLYNQGDLYIIGALCFCFSVTYFALNLLLAALVIYITDSEDEDGSATFVIGGIVSVLYLSLSIIFCYWMEWGFKTFVFVAFLYLILRTIISAIMAGLKSDNSTPKKEEQNPTIESSNPKPLNR